ncbi:hypothetical protein TrVFT333_007084 [Trichoderma virens FT-333]|nr:hypothetical protein TrVFT333_007084 [Trichoderma virens FT-333]
METKVVQYEDLAAVFVCAEKVLSLTIRGMVYEIVYLQDASSNIATKELQKTLVDLYKALLQLISSIPSELIENQGIRDGNSSRPSPGAEKLQSWFKIYIASRMEVDIIRNLRHRSDISINPSYGKGDIEKYVEQEMRLHVFSNKWESVSEGVRAKVSRTIPDLSSGNFVLAYLQWEQVKKLKTDRSILRGLENLPKSLDQAYHEIYSQNNGVVSDILQWVMKWVFCAQEPLSNEQLLSAIRLEAWKGGLGEAVLTTSGLITQSTLELICGNLIVRDSRLKVWKFFHASAAEFSKGYVNQWPRNPHEDVAVLLISCLIDCYSRWITPPTSERFKSWLLEHKLDPDDYLDLRHPLQSYARRFWELGDRRDLRVDSINYVQRSIFGICALGLHTLLEGWWEDDIDVSLVNSSGMDLLSIAAKYGHQELCSALIDFGSDISGTLNSVHGSALSEAIHMNHVDIAALLLDRGHNPNTYSDGKILLCIAVERAEWAVPMLLSAEADPNIPCQTCEYGGALEAAVRMGKVDIAKMLIQSGADVNLSAGMGDYGRPLAAAVYCGWSLECADLLIEHGADVNAQPKHGRYGSALVAAVGGISPRCINFLIAHGADVNAVLEHGNFGSALAAAASESSLECLELLISQGADVNALLKCGDFGSALAAAASEESPECVKSLLEHGADANALLEHGDFGSALAAAASRKSLECVKLLLENGADVNAQLKCGDFGTALAAAVFGWSEDIEIVKYLVEEAGADTGMLLSNKRWVAMCKHYHHSEDADFVRKVRYLVEGGFVEENVLADLHVSEQ